MSRSSVLGKGLFVTFEGGEGSGKTTQIRALGERLRAAGHEVVMTREPGGTPEAEKIRDLLVQRDGGAWTGMAECLLFFAARVMHVQNLIRPALSAGKIVLCDRFTDSTIAYQAGGRGLPGDKVRALAALALDGFEPDLTFILDIDPVEGLRRSESRLATTSNGKEKHEDRFERLDLSFHKNLRQAYLGIARDAPERCRVIEATLERGIITDILEKETLEMIGAA